MSKLNQWLTSIVRSPILWGSVASIAFYTAINRGFLSSELLRRYCAGHPVEYVETILFFVAFASLLLKLVELAWEPRRSDEPWLGSIPPEKQSPQESEELLARLEVLEPKLRESRLGIRFRDVLESVRRHGSAEKLDDDLHMAADNTAGEAHARQALVRVIISSIPILGFLGTVVGITDAVAQLAKVVGNVSFSDAINSVVSGLSVAFDTTALALILSMGLMFLLYFVNRLENSVLADIDAQATQELSGRFQAAVDHQRDPNVAVIRQMATEVVQSSERLVERQAALWEQTVESAQKRWTSQAVTTERQLETALTKALRTSLDAHAQQIREAEQTATEAGTKRWQQAVAALERGTAVVAAQQAELHQQGKLLREVVDATGRVVQLEDALNRNLGALAGAHHFEQTVLSLSAAINMLGARLGQPTVAAPRVELRPASNRTGHAA
ncbi:MAG: MotA/TolQ/ExbB proton channel family protein [Planctomycetes bacterium]|nr:MotA/TolQ/ExbB proton channel family protein [Planctomycetota bacterium]